jgi:hypothetical protein
VDDTARPFDTTAMQDKTKPLRGGGPRTAEGRARIAEYQRERWRRFREERAAEKHETRAESDAVVSRVWDDLSRRSAPVERETKPSRLDPQVETCADIPEAPWQRNRRLRLEQIERENEHGNALADRYGDGGTTYANVAYPGLKRRRKSHSTF